PDLVQGVGHVAHVLRLSPDQGRGVVHHHHRVFGHYHDVSGRGDERGRRCGQPVHVDGNRCRVPGQYRVDRLTGEDVAARAVYVDPDLVHVPDGLEILTELGRGHLIAVPGHVADGPGDEQVTHPSLSCGPELPEPLLHSFPPPRRSGLPVSSRGTMLPLTRYTWPAPPGMGFISSSSRHSSALMMPFWRWMARPSWRLL